MSENIINYDIIKKGYDFAIDVDGQLHALTAGDHNYEETGLYVSHIESKALNANTNNRVAELEALLHASENMEVDILADKNCCEYLKNKFKKQRDALLEHLNKIRNSFDLTKNLEGNHEATEALLQDRTFFSFQYSEPETNIKDLNPKIATRVELEKLVIDLAKKCENQEETIKNYEKRKPWSDVIKLKLEVKDLKEQLANK